MKIRKTYSGKMFKLIFEKEHDPFTDLFRVTLLHECLEACPIQPGIFDIILAFVTHASEEVFHSWVIIETELLEADREDLLHFGTL